MGRLQKVISININTICCIVISDPIMKLKPTWFEYRKEYSSAPTLLTWLHGMDKHKHTFSYILLITNTKFYF